MASSQRHAETSSPAEFAATRWSLVLSARANDSPQSDAALEILCRNYWRPLYAYVRRQGISPHDAQDLTQAFFARLLEKNYLAAVAQGKGKFRSFLLASLKHFLANEWDKIRAQKRGGGKTFVSIDYEVEEVCCAIKSMEDAPDAVFERRWAVTLLERTLARLRQEYAADGKEIVFEQLKETLTGERQSVPYATIARELATSEGAVKVAVHRLRRRYREILRAEIADTVSGHDEIDGELRHLFAVLGS